MIKNSIEKVNEIPATSLNDLEQEVGEKINYKFHPIVDDLHDMVVVEIVKERERVKRLERLGVY